MLLKRAEAFEAGEKSEWWLGEGKREGNGRENGAMFGSVRVR